MKTAGRVLLLAWILFALGVGSIFAFGMVAFGFLCGRSETLPHFGFQILRQPDREILAITPFREFPDPYPAGSCLT